MKTPTPDTQRTGVTSFSCFLFLRQEGQFDGIFGLGFDRLSSSKTVTPFHQLILQHQVQDPVFAFFLGNDAPGELTIGKETANAGHTKCPFPFVY
jgi:hypothetical protein